MTSARSEAQFSRWRQEYLDSLQRQKEVVESLISYLTENNSASSELGAHLYALANETVWVLSDLIAQEYDKLERLGTD